MKKILVIEDEEEIRLHILKILSYEGFHTVEASNGVFGIEYAKKYHPDLILCDIYMPELNGYRVLAKLRSDPVTAHIPFIFLTAKATLKDFRQGMRLGADDYICKPFRSEDLLTAIRTRLKKQVLMSQQMENLRVDLSTLLPRKLMKPLKEITALSEFLGHIDFLPEPPEIADMGKTIYEYAFQLRRLIENYLIYTDLMLMKHDPELGKKWREVEVVMTRSLIRFFASYVSDNKKRRDDLILNLVDAKLRIAPQVLQKIVIELLDNAFKFSEPGTVVQITSHSDRTRFFLNVIDHGRGMTQTQLDSFHAMLRGERKWHTYQGPGLGLILCCLLTQLHGGMLRIDSVRDKGTTVKIVLSHKV